MPRDKQDHSTEMPPFSPTRRQILRYGTGGASLALLAACQTVAGPAPNWYMVRGRNGRVHRGNFKNHLSNYNISGEINHGGLDLRFVHGAPIVSPVAGVVLEVDSNPFSGNVVHIAAGLTRVLMAHLNEVYVRRGTRVDRQTVVGTEGRTGKNARGKSHVHISVYGNGAVHDLGDNKDENFPRQGYVLDPDGLTADGNSLILNPWIIGTDHDAPYRAFAANEVIPRLKALRNNWPDADLRKIIRVSPQPLTLFATIHRLWQYDNKLAAGERRADPATIRLREEIGIVFAKAREGTKMINLTSPYINHTDAATICHIAARNPRYSAVILKFYGKFAAQGCTA